MSVFSFKFFDIRQSGSAMKVGTDAMVLGALVDAKQANKCLDIGTGTGVLAMMIAQRNEGVIIDAIEINDEAFKDCLHNFEQSPWSHRLNVQKGDILKCDIQKHYDLIISNPPFYRNTLQNIDDSKSLARHEAHLKSHDLLSVISGHLTEVGTCWLIFPYVDLSQWQKEAAESGLFPKKIVSISGKYGDEPNRAVVCFSKNNNETIVEEQLSVRDKEGNYTGEYIQLTENFHGKTL